MKTIFYISISFFLTKSFSQAPIDDSHWELIEEWDFKTMSFSEIKSEWYFQDWTHALDFGGGFVEPQYYQPENISVSTEGLVITVKEESVFGKVTEGLESHILMSDGEPNERTFNYTSGYVETKDSLKYGYIEGRMKIPYGYDYFPAFWTFKYSNAAANGAEIDIFEMLPSDFENEPFYPNNKNVQKTNVHLFYPEVGVPSRNENIIIADYTNYHTYGVEWSPSKIIWYFDNKIIRILENPGVHDYTKTILNMALTPFVSLNSELTNYPANFEIDYVKWYKLKEECNLIVNDCSFYFGGYENTVKRSIIIGGGGCNNVQPTDSNLILRASEGVTINGNFEVPLGSELYIDVNECD